MFDNIDPPILSADIWL